MSEEVQHPENGHNVSEDRPVKKPENPRDSSQDPQAEDQEDQEDEENLEELLLDLPPDLTADLDTIDNNGQEKPDLAREKNIESINTWHTEGRKLYLVDNFQLASEKLSAAAELAARVYGQFGPEGFLPHLYYGKTLVELARAEFQVVNVAPEEEDSSSDEEDVKIPKEESKDDAKKDEDDQDSDEKASKASTHDSVDLEDAPETKEATDKTLEPVEPLPDDDEDPTVIQMAWEVLEVARAICDKQEQTKEWSLNKADVLITLGDISILDEKFDQAVADITEAINIMKQHMEENDRRLSEGYFQLGRAHEFWARAGLTEEFEKAAEAYHKAVQVFEKRKEFLEASLPGADEEKKRQLQQDLDDVKALIPEMSSQVADMLESAKDLRLKKKEDSSLTSPVKLVSEPSTSSADVPTSDLTFLVRRKRPAGPTQEEPKVKQGNDLKQTSSDA